MPVKRRRLARPKRALRVTTYERLNQYLAAFADEHFHLLILVGSGGLAKSRSVRAVLDAARAAGSRATPHPLACT